MATTVKYFYGNTLLGTGTTAPNYPLTTSAIPEGAQVIKRELWVDGELKDTDTVNVTVNASGGGDPATNLDPLVQPYMTASGIVNDGTVYNSGTAQQMTGAEWYGSVNQLVNDLQTAIGTEDLTTRFTAIYPFGNSANSSKFNLLNPQDTDAAFRKTFLGGWAIDGTGAKGNGTNTVINTHQRPDVIWSANGNNHGAFIAITEALTGMAIQSINNSTQRFSMGISASNGNFNVASGGPYTDTGAAPVNGVYGFTKQGENTATAFLNGVKVFTLSPGAAIPTEVLAEGSAFAEDTIAGTPATSKISTTAYVIGALSDAQCIAISNAIDAFEFNMKRKSW